MPCHKCPWIQTKANVAIKSVFNLVVPCAVPRVAVGHGDGGWQLVAGLWCPDLLPGYK